MRGWLCGPSPFNLPEKRVLPLLRLLRVTAVMRAMSVMRVMRAMCAMSVMGSMLVPLQLGYGTPLGSEAAVHAARQFVACLSQDQVFLKLDFKNAFNSVRRDKVLQSARQHIPEVFPLCVLMLFHPFNPQVRTLLPVIGRRCTAR